MNYETTIEIELALSKHFDIRRNTIVPNISWGLGLHECDILMLSKSGYATEIEIKVSRSDLKKDKEKRHNHSSSKIKNFWFAIPEKLGVEFALSHIPERAGLIVVTTHGQCMFHKEPIVNKSARKFNEQEVLKMAQLGAMRIWGLKSKVVDKNNQIKNLKLELKESKTKK